MAPPAERGHPRRLAYSSDFSQWVTLVNNIPPLASRLNGLSIANVVDHTVPHRGDPELFWNPYNRQSMCIRCHNVKADREVIHR